jgi:hypothetical protein
MNVWSRCEGPGGMGTRINKGGVASRGYKIKCYSGITRTKNSRMHIAEISIHWTAIGGMGRP